MRAAVGRPRDPTLNWAAALPPEDPTINWAILIPLGDPTLNWAVAQPPGESNTQMGRSNNFREIQYSNGPEHILWAIPRPIAFAMQVPLVVAAFLMVARVPSARWWRAAVAVQQAMPAVVVDPAVSTSKHHDLTLIMTLWRI